MGFMGLIHWVESDSASDFRSDLIGHILETSVKELKNASNEYNTPGAINIALVLEAGVYDSLEDYEFEEYVDTLFKPLVKQLKYYVKYSREHKKEYTRMLKSVEKFCKKKNIKL